MGLFYSKSNKEILEIRNIIFQKEGIPALEKNGFQKSPFSTAWYGKDDLKDYSYELCRLTTKSLTILVIIGLPLKITVREWRR